MPTNLFADGRMAFLLVLLLSATVAADPPTSNMPQRGICAHRGASATHPENTLVAFAEAINLGAHMIEFDVALTRDQHVMLMHDATIDRTTKGSGRIADMESSDLKQLDAGRWKHPRFAGERIPTLHEALVMMPTNVWLNVHLKGDGPLAANVAREIAASNRLHQAFLACGVEAARQARDVQPEIMICNMDRQAQTAQYVDETIAGGANFIQLLRMSSAKAPLVGRLRLADIRVNYCCTDDPALLQQLWNWGVQFPLVDRVAEAMETAHRAGIAPLEPIYRDNSPDRYDSP